MRWADKGAEARRTIAIRPSDPFVDAQPGLPQPLCFDSRLGGIINLNDLALSGRARRFGELAGLSTGDSKLVEALRGWVGFCRGVRRRRRESPVGVLPKLAGRMMLAEATSSSASSEGERGVVLQDETSSAASYERKSQHKGRIQLL